MGVTRTQGVRESDKAEAAKSVQVGQVMQLLGEHVHGPLVAAGRLGQAVLDPPSRLHGKGVERRRQASSGE